MSLVFWSKGDLFADSMFEDGAAGGTDFAKVIIFDKPIIAQVKIDDPELPPIGSYTQEQIDNDPVVKTRLRECLDYIHGGFFAGNLNVGKRIVETLREIVGKNDDKKRSATTMPVIPKIIDSVNSAANFHLIGVFNTCSVVLIGSKKLYVIEINSDGRYATIVEKLLDCTFGFGTGGDRIESNSYLVEKLLDESMHISVAALLTSIQDKKTGGWLEWWSSLPSKDPKSFTMKCIGHYKPRTNSDMPALLAMSGGEIIFPDFVSMDSDILGVIRGSKEESQPTLSEAPAVQKKVSRRNRPLV